MLRKKIRGLERKMPNRRNQTKIKWDLIWLVVHLISLSLLTLIPYLKEFSFFPVIILGAGITLIASIVRIYTRKYRFKINKRFFFWAILNSAMVGLFLFLVSYLDWHFNLKLILVAVGLVLGARVIRYLNFRRRNWIKWSLLIIVILFFALPNPLWEDGKDSISNKLDLGENESIVKKTASNIGDIFEYYPENKEESIEAFNYVNEMRVQKGLSKMKWDERAYTMAVERSKDMEERNYFSHKTPEGECMLTLKSNYGFSNSETVAENIWMISGGSADAQEAVVSWIGSPGHHANLFYNIHVSGAIGCYEHYCVFNGVNNDPYGLGAAPCSMY